MNIPRKTVTAIALVATALLFAPAAQAASAAAIDADAKVALEKLYRDTPAAKVLADKAKGILIFPRIIKGGFIVGAQWGDGALQVGSKATKYYRSLAASYGLQAGLQWYGYALMFMDDASLKYLDKSEGWEIGTGPSIVIVDKGMGKNLTSTTLRSGVYAFIFSQEGLMAGLSLQGSKITQITPD